MTLETTATATRSTGSIPICRRCTPRVRGSSRWDDHEVDNNYAATSRSDERPPDGVPGAARRRLPGLLRAHAAAPAVAAARPVDAALSAVHVRPAGGVLRARHAAVPHRPALRRRPQGAVPGRVRPAGHDARRGAGAAGCRRPRSSRSGTWNVLPQQVMMAQVDRAPRRRRALLDGPVARLRRRADAAAASSSRDAACREPGRADRRHPLQLGQRPERGLPRRRKRRSSATEFVGTSISSAAATASTSRPRMAAVLAENPFVKFYNAQRGYVSCEVTPQAWQCRLPGRRLRHDARRAAPHARVLRGRGRPPRRAAAVARRAVAQCFSPDYGRPEGLRYNPGRQAGVIFRLAKSPPEPFPTQMPTEPFLRSLNCPPPGPAPSRRLRIR